ncbi:MAG: Phosphoglucomutase-3 [Pleopsidium flavum]|nr:MAG: Phosphoglucomutase-3 [Pleopsidium flavum]
MVFGTAGLRARMGAGYSRMNCLTVIQTSQGLAEYILKLDDSPGRKTVVIGYDVRKNSKQFAELSAIAFINKGFKVFFYHDYVHTPLVSFTVKLLSAAAGVMITASHNPAHDNGYKVYWGPSGCQINSPHDAGIARSILDEDNLKPISWNTVDLDTNPNLQIVTAHVLENYYEAVYRLAKWPEHVHAHTSFVYTPIHGTGLVFMKDLAQRLGYYDDMIVVEPQADPNANFPTVEYPNPEETGALDLAYATADRNQINLVLANDPDADRFAVAEKVNDGWYRFTGDQVGVLLASASLAAYSSETGDPPSETGDPPKKAVLSSAVSTGMIAQMAIDEGFPHEETLTGFKWLGGRAMNRNDVLFAFEEALGYMWPAVCYDKDGITAAAVFSRAVATWRQEEDLSPWGKLQQLYTRHGFFESMNTYFRSIDPATTFTLFEKIKQFGKPYPAAVGDRKVLRWRDLTIPYDSANPPSYASTLPTVSDDSPMITCWLAPKSQGTYAGESVALDHGVRFTVRASGTEPKIKLYLECQSRTSQRAKNGAAEVLQHLISKWFNNPGLKVEPKYRRMVSGSAEKRVR